MKKMLLFMFVVTRGISCFADIPPKNRPDRAKYVSSFLKDGDVGAEIGVMNGVCAYHVLLQKNPSRLYLIDPWQAFGNNANQQGWDERYERVCRLFEPYENVEILRHRSEDAVMMFSDEYFDYVYIDGEHSYAAVTRDLTNYFPKVKVGGYLIGDDYGWTGIEPAVQDFLLAHRDDCLFLSPSAGQFAIKRIK